MTLEEKLEKAKTFIGTPSKTVLMNEQGNTQLYDTIIKNAWILKDLVLVDFEGIPKHPVNIDIVGTLQNNRFVPLCE